MSWSTIASRGVAFSLIWWILADGILVSWWIGVPAVLLAIIVSVALLPPVPLVWLELLRFVPFFFMHSLIGGADVAWRALHPGMPIAPDLITYPLRLPPGLPQVFMVNIFSLLPGTLSVELGANSMRVHVLDARQDFFSELESVEQSVAALFGVSLAASSGGE